MNVPQLLQELTGSPRPGMPNTCRNSRRTPPCMFVLLSGIIAALMLISACVVADGDPPDEPGTEALITSFILASTDNPGLSADVEADIHETVISAELPEGSDRSSLVPSITISEGASIDPPSGEAADFSSTVNYTVTAEDGVGSTDYEVTFSVATGSDPGGGSSYPAVVMRTGQNNSYLSGDDGDIQAGSSWPDPRFSDNGDGTITDNATGLIWEKTPSATTRTWEQALDFANSSLVGGHDDWRLPNIRELESLINYEPHSQAAYDNQIGWLEENGFANLTSGYYWSSTSLPWSTSNAYVIFLAEATFNALDKTATGYLICVRGTAGNIPQTGQTESYFTGDDGDLEMGVPWPDPRFTDNGDNTIRDELTGLMWEKVPTNQDGNTLEDVIALADASWTGGHNDWRVPNIREFRSLFHAGVENMDTWLETQGFSGVITIGAYLCFTATYSPHDETIIYLQDNDSAYVNNYLNRDSIGNDVYHWLVRGTPWN